MILQTQRLVLRPMAPGDAPALFAILGDPEAMRFWHRPALPRLSTAQALMADELAAMAAGGFYYWTVWKGGDAIGSLDLSHADGISAWAGFLFRKDQWGHGYAAESLAAVIAHAFGPLRLSRLMAQVQPGNARAVRLLERQGFHREGALDAEPALWRLNRFRRANGA